MKNKIRIILLVVIILLTIPIIISTNYNSPIKLIINNQEYIIYEDTEELNLREYNAYDDLTIVKKTLKSNVKVDNKKLKYNKLLNINKQNINKNNKHVIEIKYMTGKKRKININIYPSTLKDINTSGNSKFYGDYYLSTINEKTIFNYQLIINEEGSIVYYKQTESPSYYFQKNKLNDEVLYTYIQNNNLIVEDDKFSIINTISDVDRYVVLSNGIVVYGNNKLRYIEDNKEIWSLDKKIDNIFIDNDNVLLTIDNRIEKIDVSSGLLIWKIDSKKGTYKLSNKQKISNIKSIVNIGNNKYRIITDKKIIDITLGKKKIKSFKSKKISNGDIYLVDYESGTYISKSIDKGNSIYEENNLRIEINANVSGIYKK